MYGMEKNWSLINKKTHSFQHINDVSVTSFSCPYLQTIITVIYYYFFRKNCCHHFVVMSYTVPVFADTCQVVTGSYNQQGYADFLNVQVEGVH